MTELACEDDHSDLERFESHKKRALYGVRQSTYILRGEYYNSLRKKSMGQSATSESQEAFDRDKGSKAATLTENEQAQLDKMEADFNKHHCSQ